MSTANYACTGTYNVRIVNDLRCPHCGSRVSPHAIEGCDRNGWRAICLGCHRDLIAVEPTE
jgi:hypothetical protein